MVPRLEHDVNRDGAEMLEEPVGGPARGHRLATVRKLKARRLRVTSTLARVSFPWPKLCSRLYPLFFRTLNVSFSIFQRAATGGDVRRDRQIGDETIEIRPFSPRVLDFDGEPVHRQCVICVT